jgi:hypothetical protein
VQQLDDEKERRREEKRGEERRREERTREDKRGQESAKHIPIIIMAPS